MPVAFGSRTRTTGLGRTIASTSRPAVARVPALIASSGGCPRTVSGLLDAFRVGDGVYLIRESVRLVMQELIDVEATEFTVRTAPIAEWAMIAT